MSLNFRDCHARIRQVDSLGTVDDAVVVQVVSGELSNNGQLMRKFMQTFILVPQSPKKYYVHNDIFRYQDEVFTDDVTPHNQMFDITHQINELKVQDDMGNSSSSNYDHQQLLLLQQQQQQLLHINQQLPPPPPPVFQSCQQLEMLMSPSSMLPQQMQQSKHVATNDDRNSSNVEPAHDSNEFPKLSIASTSTNATSTALASPTVITTTTSSLAATMTTNAIVTSTGTPVTTTTIPSVTTNSNSEAKSTTISTNVDQNQNGIKTKSAATAMIMTTTSTKDEELNRKNQLSWAELAGKKNDEVDVIDNINNLKQQLQLAGSCNNAASKHDCTATSKTATQSTMASSSAQASVQLATLPITASTSLSTTQHTATTTTATTITTSQTTSHASGNKSGFDQLFVGNLPNDITRQQLVDFFSKFGTVVEVRISKKMTHNNVPNFGFVKFESVEVAEKVLQSKPLHLDNGHRLNVEEKRSDQVKSLPNKMSANQSRYAQSSPPGKEWWGGHRSGYTRGNQNKGYGGANNKYKPSN